LPLDAASALGGWIGRSLGPRLRLTERARRNLRASFPEASEEWIAATILDMWDNLGRVLGEFPHLQDLTYGDSSDRVEVIGLENIRALADGEGPGLLVGGHLGNWEIGPYSASAVGSRVALIYRAANNPYVEKLFRRARRGTGGEMLRKGSQGARRSLEILKDGGRIGILVDQKMNDGIAVPFFGRPAMTAAAAAQMALRYQCRVVVARVVRKKGAWFQAEFLPPRQWQPTGDRQADALARMTEINQILEGWIRENPGQWLWLHKRWPE